MDKVAKAKIVVMFADIRGSSRWTRRMAEDEDKRHSFMMAYDKECQFYRNRTNANLYKRLGDGRMFVHELSGRDHSKIASLILNEALGLIRRIDRIIASLPTPRPPGFRVRIMFGTVNREPYPDGEEDWIGYIPNTCHKFLAVAPEVACLIQEGFVELIRREDAKQYGFSFTLLTGNRVYPDGVDREDVDTLWVASKKR